MLHLNFRTTELWGDEGTPQTKRAMEAAESFHGTRRANRTQEKICTR
jgi:hypothetical protein